MDESEKIKKQLKEEKEEKLFFEYYSNGQIYSKESAHDKSYLNTQTKIFKKKETKLQKHKIIFDNNNKDKKSFEKFLIIGNTNDSADEKEKPKSDNISIDNNLNIADKIPMKLPNIEFYNKLSLNKIIELYRIIFFLLFLKLFSFSSQVVQAVFFCDDWLKDVYIVEGHNLTKIAYGGPNGNINSFNLSAAPGDLIRIICYNSDGGWSYGAGCFVINDQCRCDNFNIDMGKKANLVTRSHDFGNKICSMTNIQFITEENQRKNYEYEKQIPLDVNGITCKNSDNVLFVAYREKHVLNLKDYITANFELKNLEVTIIENYNYFSINDLPLGANEKFKILNDLTFYSNDIRKIRVKFINYGIILTDTKECQFYISFCHERCLECFDGNISKNNHQCIKCKEGFYKVENTNNCKRKQEMNLAKYYLNETEQMFKRSNKDCKTNLDENLENYIIDDEFNTTDIENGQDEIIKCNDMIITLSTTDAQKDAKKNLDTTTVDLNKCEDILRKEYNISENETIIMKKIEYFQEGMKIPKIVYDVYNKLNGTNLIKLDLSFCANVKVDISIPIEINENLDKFNSSSDYYKDICYTATSDNGSDMILRDRKKEFIEKNMTICQESCFFSEYDYDTKRAKCSCDIIETFSSLKDIKIDKTKLFNNFIDIKNIGNIRLLPCYNVLFTKKGLIKNYGSYVIIFIFLFHIILIILFFAKRHFKKIKRKIKNIKFAINNWGLVIAERKRKKLEKKLAKKKEKERQIKDEQIQNQNKEETEKEIMQLPENLQIKKANKKSKNRSTRNKNNNNNKKLKDKSIIDINENNNNDNISNNINNNEIMQINNINSENKKEIPNENDVKVIEKAEKIMEYNYDELNDLPYEEAKRRDKRTFCLYYLSLLKTNQDIMFTFFYNFDYNLKIIKIDLFLNSFTLFFATNALFFSDDTMHQIYEDKGAFDLIYQLPQIIYSSLISYVFKFLLDILALSESLIIKFKENKTTKDLNNRVRALKKYIKIKFGFYFIISTILLLFFWYYVSIFCAVYANTQIHLIKDTIISYILSLISPFLTYLIPGFFRIPALSNHKKNGKCLYNASKFLQMLCSF